ncbi:MAG: holin [Eggerthellaceae bacterium]|nr:holin [Eggerthellaceae bacterium]
MTQITKEKLKEWLVAALIRALKTWAQAGVAYIGTSAVGILGFDWVGFFSITGMAFVLSILTSIAGLPEVSNGETLPSIMTTVEASHAKEE